MASSRTPLLTDNRRKSVDSNCEDDEEEETTFLYGFATTSPTRPFAIKFNPTLSLRSLALLLAIPAFIVFVVLGSDYAATIVFLSLAIARQAVVLGSHFGSRIVSIKIEVVHPGLRSVSAKAQDTWIKKIVPAVTDGVILLGLLVSLSLVAHEVDVCQGACHLPVSLTAAVILGFIVFGLLLLSVPDFGNPSLFALLIAVEKPDDGVLKFVTSLVFGELDSRNEDDEY